MKCIESEFQSNANGMGVMIFRLLCRGISDAGKTVYVFSRRYPHKDKPSIWEVFIPSVKKAGTYALPGGKSITYAEDFEEYPGASKFGFSAWDCNSQQHAELIYNRLMNDKETVEAPEESTNSDNSEKAETIDSEPKHRGRPRVDRPVLIVPAMEFSVKDLAAHNHVEYPTAFLFVKESLERKEIHFVREERRASRGKPTKIFANGAA